jgi:outer membrane protein assembly factor BamB
MNKKLISALLLVALLQCPSTGDNWAHWRGPAGNGVAPNARPPVRWSSTGNVKWKVAIPGRSSGSPVIWEDRVFVVTAVPVGSDAGQQAGSPDSAARPQSQGDPRLRQFPGRRGGGGAPLTKLAFKVLCFDRSTGQLLWEQTAKVATPHQATHATNGFASASPCTDGQHVYAHFGSRGLYCYTMDGKLRWKRDDFGKMDTRSNFGEGSSPTLEGDKILVPWDHEGPSFLYALDKLTGETIWKTERDEPSCWATPLVVEHGGVKQVVMNGQTCARAYDLETGKELWRCGGQTERPVASAVAADGLVVIGSGFRGAFLGAFRLDGQGNIENTDHVIWTLNRDTPDIASPLLSDGRVYFHKGKTGMLSCVDAATGKPHYTVARIPGLSTTYASPIAAGGHVYLTGRSGTTVVIKDADQLEIVASNSVGETVDATPAPVDNELFIRGERHLFCISE